MAAGRWWSSDEIDAMARGWRLAILDRLGNKRSPVAVAVPTTPEGVALFAAATSLHVPVIVLATNDRGWHSDPTLPAGTTLVLPPSLARCARAATRLGWLPWVLSDGRSSARASSLPVLECPGIVLLSSGSTGSPKLIFRATQALLAGAAARLTALGLEPGDGVVVGASFAHGLGLTRLLSAMLLGGPLALLDPLDHRAALSALALPAFTWWSATAHFADVLGRCALTEPAIAPRICLVSSPTSRGVFDRFLDRFGVPLRLNYSSTETGSIAVDSGPPSTVRFGTVGHPVSGVDVRIGDHPDDPLPPNEVGRVWTRSPWQMTGYGFPPAVARPDDVDGWWPTRDLGTLQADGRLALVGRLDDCVRTREDRLVNLGAVAVMLEELTGVREAAVVRLDGTAGASFGTVVKCDPSVTLATLRARVADGLPRWAWPRKIALVSSLPLLPNRKPDRQACVALLGGRVVA